MTKKQFFAAVFGTALAIILIGFVLPWLISAKSGIAVGIALVLVFVLVVGIPYYLLFSKKVEK